MYSPSEDSYFFAEFLKKYIPKNKDLKFLDMGTGSGILAKTALDFGINPENIFAVDINKKVMRELKKSLPEINSFESDLFSSEKFKNKKFDLIVFNAPYLPQDKKNLEPLDSQIETTGGKNGDEISLRFLKQAKKHLEKNGKILLLISNLTPLKNIKKFNPKILTKKSLFFEELLILEFSKNP